MKLNTECISILWMDPTVHNFSPISFNPLLPSGVIYWYVSGSILSQEMAWCHQARSHELNQTDLTPNVFCAICLRAISQEVPINLIRDMCSLNTLLKLPYCSGTTRYEDGTPTSEVTPVTIRYIRPPNHGHTSQYHGHEWMTHILFVHC